MNFLQYSFIFCSYFRHNAQRKHFRNYYENVFFVQNYKYLFTLFSIFSLFNLFCFNLFSLQSTFFQSIFFSIYAVSIYSLFNLLSFQSFLFSLFAFSPKHTFPNWRSSVPPFPYSHFFV